MKIELKLTSDQIFAAATLFENIYQAAMPNTIKDKVTRSISFEISDKLTSKKHSLYKSNNLFEVKKKHKITFKYHEANTLYEVIEYFLPEYSKEGKAHNDLFMLKNTIHQKLI